MKIEKYYIRSLIAKRKRTPAKNNAMLERLRMFIIARGKIFIGFNKKNGKAYLYRIKEG